MMLASRLASVALALLACAAPAAWSAQPNAADVKNGEILYGRCVACHALAYDRTGPRHCGLFGRRAGSVKGFEYSAAMKRSTVVWNAASLDRFLTNPLKAIPGTAMGYAGVTDAKERADLIAYLRAANASADCHTTAE
jgi:cytochrome c